MSLAVRATTKLRNWAASAPAFLLRGFCGEAFPVIGLPLVALAGHRMQQAALLRQQCPGECSRRLRKSWWAAIQVLRTGPQALRLARLALPRKTRGASPVTVQTRSRGLRKDGSRRRGTARVPLPLNRLIPEENDVAVDRGAAAAGSGGVGAAGSFGPL